MTPTVETISLPLNERDRVCGALPAVMTVLRRAGVIVLRNAFSETTLREEYRRRAGEYLRFQVIYNQHVRRLSSPGDMIAVETSVGQAVNVDSASVIYAPNDVARSILDACFSFLMLAKTRLELEGTGKTSYARPRLSRGSAFVNYYMGVDSNGIIVGDHVDKSVLTLLTAAVDLTEPGSAPIRGLEYFDQSANTYVELVPSAVNDVIVMCGVETRNCHEYDSLVYPPLRHRVRNVESVSKKRRFTMVFKVH